MVRYCTEVSCLENAGAIGRLAQKCPNAPAAWIPQTIMKTGNTAEL